MTKSIPKEADKFDTKTNQKNGSSTVMFTRNRLDISWEKTLRGIDVNIVGRWQGRDSKIFLELEYVGDGEYPIMKATKNSYMSGYRTLEPDYFDSPVKGLTISSYGEDRGDVVCSRAVKYSRAQRKLVPEIMEKLLDLLPFDVEQQKEVRKIYLGYRSAVFAVNALEHSKAFRLEYEENIAEARELLNLDNFEIETLVSLGEEGGDIVVLAKNIKTLLK